MVENTTKTTTTIKPVPQKNSTMIKTLDTTKGVITSEIYQSGHIGNEFF
jgi:hypothetical protein